MELTINLPHGDERLAMIGTAERNLKIIREQLGVAISAREGVLRISGASQAVGRSAQVLEELARGARRRQSFSRQQVEDLIAQATRNDGGGGYGGDNGGAGGGAGRVGGVGGNGGHGGHGGHLGHAGSPLGAAPLSAAGGLEVYARGRRIRAMTDGQRDYLEAILAHDLSFCIGPAGTGKTYLAVAAAVSMLRRGDVRKLVLVRPAVEAGEKLGFLPGGMQEKVNPYLRPLLDALHDMIDFEQIQRFMAVDVIEIIPLAFMRGRTLNDACVILDEAQNTTRQQMLMFLTRLGHGSKMIVTGDTTQTDLPDIRESGLVDAARRLRRVKGVAFVTLAQGDIVRHSLVQRVVEAYGPPARRGASRPVARQDKTAGKADNNPED